MVSWGFVAALTALVKTPVQFYGVRFLLGVAEAGFFPGVIVYLTHWFPARDRAKALSWFFVATPVAQFLSPRLSYFLLRIGTTETIKAWRCITRRSWDCRDGSGCTSAGASRRWSWGSSSSSCCPTGPGMPAGSSPTSATPWSRSCAREKDASTIRGTGHMIGPRGARAIPRYWLLAAAYFFVVSASYGVEMFLPSILEKWYKLNLSDLTWAVIIPPLGGLVGQLLVGWSSDRTGERRLHGAVPIFLGAAALAGSLMIPPRCRSAPGWRWPSRCLPWHWRA